MNQVTCLITGASSGIGYELSKNFVKRGLHVVAVARSKDKLDQLSKECGNKGPGRLETLCLDIVSDIPKLVGKLKSFDKLNILVNNAGYLINKRFEEISTSDLEEVYKTNLFAPFRLTQALIPYLTAADWAHVVNISSLGGVGGSAKFPGLSAYSSSKGALNILTECLAEEYKDSKIRFNALALGAVQTEMLSKAFPGYNAPISPKEMADYISQFAINDWRYINGKVLSVARSTP